MSGGGVIMIKLGFKAAFCCYYYGYYYDVYVFHVMMIVRWLLSFLEIFYNIPLIDGN